MSAPLGRVAWPEGGWVAELRADGSWSLPAAPYLEPGLKRHYSDAYGGPADGPFGPGALRKLAADVGGTATILDRPGPPPGTVY